jgi:hypothetical protein
MAGSAKLFIHLEPHVLANMDNLSSRDLGHIAYAYSVRNAGNPELHEAFEKRIEEYIDEGEIFDFATMHNLIYHLIFRDNVNEKIW